RRRIRPRSICRPRRPITERSISTRTASRRSPMPAPSHITVTAPAGRLTPIHRQDGAEPGGGLLFASEGAVVRGRYAGSQSVRRAIARGDLIPCDMNGASVASAELAAAPDELPGGRIVLERRERPAAQGKAPK